MDNKRSSAPSSFDHLFGPKDPSSSSSSSSSVFSSIFSSPSPGMGRDSAGFQAANGRYGNPVNPQSHNGSSSGMAGRDSSSIYQNETAEPCYFSSSIYYGGQENYSPRTTTNSQSHHAFKKDEKNEDPNGNNSNSASRGNWWQGSLYY